MDVVAAASRCPLMGMSAFLVFDRYFCYDFCISISFSMLMQFYLLNFLT